MKKLLAFLGLLTSSSTLICCAIPALLVSLGLGAALAGAVSAFPQLVWVSEHKVVLFGVAAALILLNGILQFRSPKRACPIDPKQAQACKTAKGFAFWLYWISVGLYLIGFFFAFILPKWLE